jgi:iron(III) transport system substrate-binding protein
MLLFCSLLAACGSSETPDAAVSVSATPSGTVTEQAAQLDLYKQALANGEDEVAVYGAASDTPWQPLWREFNRAFPGIRITYLFVSPAQAMARMDAEGATGKRYADILLQSQIAIPDIAGKGYLAAWRPPTAGELDDHYIVPGDFAFSPFCKVYGLAYNTEQVRPEDLPHNFDELLEPRWQGRIGFLSPLGGADVAVATLREHGRITDQQISALAQYARPALGSETGPLELAQGRVDLYLWAYLTVVTRQQALGGPIAIAFIPDFTFDSPFAVAVVKQAAHPNAARLFSAWLLSPHGQRVLAEQSHMLTNMPNSPKPPFYPEDAEGQAKLWPALPLQEALEKTKRQRDGLRQLFYSQK